MKLKILMNRIQKMMRLNFSILAIALAITLKAAAIEATLGESYIDKFASIAIAEMTKSGIPASIKLAQGMLESDYGRSELATVAQNHFGIKCGSTWQGQTFYKEDDDYNAAGSITKSCFRAYTDPEDSYAAHSDFLKDPKKAQRYGHLFDLSITDYMGWAQGLKASGYASDPNYPNKLVYIIEKYNLSKFDNKTLTQKEFVDVTISEPMTPVSPSKSSASASREPMSKKLMFDKMDGKRYTTVHDRMDVMTMAKIAGVKVDEIIAFNDHLDFPYDIIPSGIPVFLEEKARDFNGKLSTHIVKEGETLESISQWYGIRVETLQNLNRLGKNALPLAGQSIALKTKVKSKDRPKFTRKPNKEFVF